MLCGPFYHDKFILVMTIHLYVQIGFPFTVLSQLTTGPMLDVIAPKVCLLRYIVKIFTHLFVQSSTVFFSTLLLLM